MDMKIAYTYVCYSLLISNSIEVNINKLSDCSVGEYSFLIVLLESINLYLANYAGIANR